MPVNPVNSSSNYVSVVQPQPQSHAERVAETKNDADRDDASKAVNDQNKPTVNTNGQTIGLVINIKA